MHISFICLHNQGQWNELSSAFHPVCILKVAKPTLCLISRSFSLVAYPGLINKLSSSKNPVPERKSALTREQSLVNLSERKVHSTVWLLSCRQTLKLNLFGSLRQISTIMHLLSYPYTVLVRHSHLPHATVKDFQVDNNKSPFTFQIKPVRKKSSPSNGCNKSNNV